MKMGSERLSEGKSDMRVVSHLGLDRIDSEIFRAISVCGVCSGSDAPEMPLVDEIRVWRRREVMRVEEGGLTIY